MWEQWKNMEIYRVTRSHPAQLLILPREEFSQSHLCSICGEVGEEMETGEDRDHLMEVDPQEGMVMAQGEDSQEIGLPGIQAQCQWPSLTLWAFYA